MRADLVTALAGRPADAIPPRWRDLDTLYALARQARFIVELGVGCSTVAMAMALAEKRAGRLVSLDARPEWIEATRRCLPAEAAGYAELRHSALQVTQYGGAACHRYADLPGEQADLVFVDGPSPKDVPGWNGQPVAADPLLLNLAPHAIIVFDGRRANLRFFLAHLQAPCRREQAVPSTLTIITLNP